MTTSSEGKQRLDGIGSLALVGAGKMGGAMLEGWLALGLDLKNVVVLEPQPSPQISSLAGREFFCDYFGGEAANRARNHA
jgi:hypothetical protein